MEFNGTFIIAFISFIIFTIVMNIILYKPISQIVSRRNKLIDDNYNEAKTNSQKTQNILDEKEKTLTKAHLQAKDKIENDVNSFKKQGEAIKGEAKAKAVKDIEDGKAKIISESEAAKAALKNEVIGLAQLVSDKFLNSEDKIQNANDSLIDKILQE